MCQGASAAGLPAAVFLLKIAIVLPHQNVKFAPISEKSGQKKANAPPLKLPFRVMVNSQSPMINFDKYQKFKPTIALKT